MGSKSEVGEYRTDEYRTPNIERGVGLGVFVGIGVFLSERFRIACKINATYF